MFFAKSSPPPAEKINTDQLARGIDAVRHALKCDMSTLDDDGSRTPLAGIFNQTIGTYDDRARTLTYCVMEHRLASDSTCSAQEISNQLLREEATLGKLHDQCRTLDVRISHDLKFVRSNTGPEGICVQFIVTIHPHHPYRASSLQLTGASAPKVAASGTAITRIVVPKLVFKES